MKTFRARPTILATAVAVAAALALRLGAAPQQPSQETPVFRTGIDVVRVDVTVLGRNDVAVTGLQASDFEVKEDGVVQKVDTAHFVQRNGTRTSDLDESLEIRSPEHAASE